MIEFVNDRMVAAHLPHLPDDVHKYRRGKVGIWSGSENMPGAALLTAKAAYMAGAGYVELFTESVVKNALAAAVPELVFAKFEPEVFVAAKADARLVGPGLLPDRANSQSLADVICNSLCTLVIDASALTMIANSGCNILKKCKKIPVVTPHSGEMARLMNVPDNAIADDRIECAAGFARRYGCVTVLKGPNTVIASPDGEILVNPHVNKKMATAGAGDVLAGVIAAFVAQGAEAFWAAACGCYIHGLAAVLASENGALNIMASDIFKNLPGAIYCIENKG